MVLEKFRNPVSGLTHLGAAIAAAVGLIVLLYLGHGSAPKEVSLLVYGAALVLMFSASAAYHLVNSRPAVIVFLRKVDHSSIYLLIAGTYTPICLHFFTGFLRGGLLSIVWAMAIVGIVLKVFVLRAPRWLSTGIYLLMGWLSVMAIKEMLLVMPAGALVGIIAGGIFFTLGAIVYATQWPNFVPEVFGFHEVWHIFVILGCLSHFLVVAIYVAPHTMI